MLAAEKFLENWTTILKVLVVLFLVIKYILPFFGIGGNQKKYKEQLKKEEAEIEKRRAMRAKGIRPEDHEHHHHHHVHHHKKFNWQGFLIGAIIVIILALISALLISKCCINNNKERTHRTYVQIKKEATHKAASFFYVSNVLLNIRKRVSAERILNKTQDRKNRKHNKHTNYSPNHM